jgi:hypothetical protein
MNPRRLLCIVLLALSLAACGGGGGGNATATPAGQTGQPGYPAPQLPAETATPAAYPTP